MPRYYRREEPDILRAVDRFDDYHRMFYGQKPRNILDTGVHFGGPRDLFSPEFIAEHLLPSARAYGHEAGSNNLLEAIAASENRKHGTQYNKDWVAIMPGAWAGLQFALEEAMNLHRGLTRSRHIAVVGPTLYPMFHRLINVYGMSVIAYDFVGDLPHVPQSMDDLKELFARGPQVVVITNPNNPDGVFFPPDLLRQVIDYCESAGIFVIIDEMQNCFVREGAGLGYDDRIQRPHVLRLDSPAKRYALAQYRVGWVIAHPDLLGDRQRGIVGRMSGLMANAPKSLDKALITLLELERDPLWVQRINRGTEKKRAFAELRLRQLQEMGLVRNIYPRDACVNIAFQTDAGDDLVLARELWQFSQTLMMPASGYGYEPEGVLRATFTSPHNQLRSGFDALRRLWGI